MTINSCGVSAGRLLELRIHGFRAPADVDSFADRIKAQFASLGPGERVVIVADWRHCPVLTPPVAERVAEIMGRNSPLVERNAVLHSLGQSTSLMQLARVIQEAGNPDRRLFTEPAKLEAWLGEVLDARELARLQRFLDDEPAQHRSG